MVDEPDSILLAYMRRFDDGQQSLVRMVSDVILRLGSLESQVVGLRTDFMRLEHRMDGFETRLARIERRLDLVEA